MTTPARKLLSQRAYARHRGVSHKAVQRAIETGRITLTAGKIDAQSADAQWAQNTRPQAPTPGESLPEDQEFMRARAVRENFSARTAKLDYETRAGLLIPRDRVKVAAFNASRRARDMLLNIPDRVAPVLAGMTTAEEIRRVLLEEIELVCAEFGAWSLPPGAINIAGLSAAPPA